MRVTKPAFLFVCVVAIILFLLSPKANAAEGWGPDVIGVHVGSYHLEKMDVTAGRPWNNANPGVYARWDNVVVGTYYNSIRKQSVYAGYVYPLVDHFDVVVGAITGYNGPGYSAKPIMPMVVPSMHFPISNGVEGRVHFLPKAAKGGANVIHFSLEFKL